MPTLRCSVSLLVRYEDAAHAFDWEVSLVWECEWGFGMGRPLVALPLLCYTSTAPHLINQSTTNST